MSTRDTPRSEDGFTLVELLVATTMALVVFAVTLSTLAVFNDTSQALTHRNDSQNQARLGVDQMVSQLRNVANSSVAPSFVERATPYDLVFQTISVAAGADAVERVRYCLGSPSGSPSTEAVIAQTQTNPTEPPPTQCLETSGGTGSSVVIGHVTNLDNTEHCAAGEPLFTYDGASGSPSSTDRCAALTDPAVVASIKSIGINLFVNPTPADPNNAFELQSSALLRNAQSPPVAGFTWSQDWSGTVVLDGGASYSTTDEPLTYAWSCQTSTGTSVNCPSSGSTFAWTPSTGPGTYTVTLRVTDATGLQSQPFTSMVSVQ